MDNDGPEKRKINVFINSSIIVIMPVSYMIYGSVGLLVITLIIYLVNLKKRR
jgi:hypothetical protein